MNSPIPFQEGQDDDVELAIALSLESKYNRQKTLETIRNFDENDVALAISLSLCEKKSNNSSVLSQSNPSSAISKSSHKSSEMVCCFSRRGTPIFVEDKSEFCFNCSIRHSKHEETEKTDKMSVFQTKKRKRSSLKTIYSPLETENTLKSTQTLVPQRGICAFAGCDRPTYVVQETGISYSYCSRSHGRRHKDYVNSLTACVDDANKEEYDSDVATAMALSLHPIFSPNIQAIEQPAVKDEILITKNQCQEYYPIFSEDRKGNFRAHGQNRTLTVQDTEADIPQSTKLDEAVTLFLERKKNNKNSTSPEDIEQDTEADLDAAIALSLVHQEDRNFQNYLVEAAFAESLEDSKVKQSQTHLLENVCSDNWVCGNCKQKNSQIGESTCPNDMCRQCREPRLFDWTCSVCLFDNCLQDTHCIICESANKLSTTVASVHYSSQCGIPGCRQKAEYYGFCSKKHSKKAERKRLLPLTEAYVDRVLLGSTGDFTVQVLKNCHPKFISVEKQFLNSWLKLEEGPGQVEEIFFIRVRPDIQEAFDNACKIVGNVKRRFHGTSQIEACGFGSDLQPPCNSADCNVCAICQQSFDLRKVRKGGGVAMQLRYGKGLYFSPVSSKSNDYARLSQRVRGSGEDCRRWRCMFLCSVAIGTPYKTTKGFLDDDQCPPLGYDSVVGLKGDFLNFEEVAIYDSSQVVPQYLIVYSLPLE